MENLLNSVDSMREILADTIYPKDVAQLSKKISNLNSRTDFVNGWNSAMSINLPVKFDLWKSSLSEEELNKIVGDGLLTHGTAFEISSELYQHWINNIYNKGSEE